MKANTRSNRAARRARAAQELTKLIRDNLQEAEAELYINGAIRNADEAHAIRTTNTALDELEERIVGLTMLLSNIKDREENPEYTEFDSLAAIAKSEGIFRDSK